MIPCDADGNKSIFLRKEGVIVIRDSPRKREGEFVPEMGLANPECLGLEFI
jgi:hypothetical protein